MTTKMKWKISRRLGIFLTINPKPTCHLQLHPASFWLHSQVLGMSILGIQVVPWSHQVPPESPTKLLIFSCKLSLRAAKPQDAGHQTFVEWFPPGEWKPPTAPSKIWGGQTTGNQIWGTKHKWTNETCVFVPGNSMAEAPAFTQRASKVMVPITKSFVKKSVNPPRNTGLFIPKSSPLASKSQEKFLEDSKAENLGVC